jgi:hypothetical protein
MANRTSGGTGQPSVWEQLQAIRQPVSQPTDAAPSTQGIRTVQAPVNRVSEAPPQVAPPQQQQPVVDPMGISMQRQLEQIRREQELARQSALEAGLASTERSRLAARAPIEEAQRRLRPEFQALAQQAQARGRAGQIRTQRIGQSLGGATGELASNLFSQEAQLGSRLGQLGQEEQRQGQELQTQLGQVEQASALQRQQLEAGIQSQALEQQAQLSQQELGLLEQQRREQFQVQQIEDQFGRELIAMEQRAQQQLALNEQQALIGRITQEEKDMRDFQIRQQLAQQQSLLDLNRQATLEQIKAQQALQLQQQLIPLQTQAEIDVLRERSRLTPRGGFGGGGGTTGTAAGQQITGQSFLQDIGMTLNGYIDPETNKFVPPDPGMAKAILEDAVPIVSKEKGGSQIISQARRMISEHEKLAGKQSFKEMQERFLQQDVITPTIRQLFTKPGR